MPPLMHRERRVANAVITDPARHTVMDARGAVRSVQAADITLPAAELEALWSPMHLERLAATYWRFLTRATLGLIQISYRQSERAVVLVTRPFVLLRFFPPEYEMAPDRGLVRWRIRDGVLVARPGRGGEGYLEIEVRRIPTDDPARARAHVEVAVANFYPAIALSIARWVYAATQSRIHVLITHAFLRSLARLDLARSHVGRFATRGPARAGPRGQPCGAEPAQPLAAQ
jgi:hypothetical protein